MILDLSAWSQLGDFGDWVRAFPGRRLVIDHHVSQDDLGAIYLKDTTAEATGTLIARAVDALGLAFTARDVDGLAHGDRDGYRLVPSPETPGPTHSGPRPA